MNARPVPLVVLDVVGLTPRLLAHMPRLRAVAESGFQAPLGTVLPPGPGQPSRSRARSSACATS